MSFSQHKQHGVSMIEILITMVVMAIGLLGLAGMQTTSLRNNQSAYHRSQAVIMANDILDRMRSNQVGVTGGNYNAVTSSTEFDTVTNCTTNVCTTEQMATYDAQDWTSRLATVLPSGVGTVTGTGAGSLFSVTIRWDDSRSGATGTNCDSSDPGDLTCFTVSSII